jgi:hypothetical protein
MNLKDILFKLDLNLSYVFSLGMETSISVKRVFTFKLEKPHNDCKKNLNSADAFNSDIFKFMITSTNYSYRQKDCFDYCMGLELIKYCNITETGIGN